MTLLPTIAIALGASIIYMSPVGAESKWTLVAEGQTFSGYLKNESLEKNGPLRRYMFKTLKKPTSETRAWVKEAHCETWQLRFRLESGEWDKWNDIKSGTVANSELFEIYNL